MRATGRRWSRFSRTNDRVCRTISRSSRPSLRSGNVRVACARSVYARWSAAGDSSMASDDPADTAYASDTHEVDTDLSATSTTSLTTPKSHTSTRHPHRRTEPCSSGSRCSVISTPSNYASEFVWITARDGTKIPVSLVYRKGAKRDGRRRCCSTATDHTAFARPGVLDPDLSLLDRGFIYAIAHVRGGQEMGRAWYEDGKLLNKMNTFTDFVDVTRFLVSASATRTRNGFSHTAAAPAACSWERWPICAADYRGDRRRRALCRRGHDDARRQHPADDQRVRRVGQPEAETLLRLHAVAIRPTTT